MIEYLPKIGNILHVQLFRKGMRRGLTTDIKHLLKAVWSCHGLVPVSFEQCLL